MPLRIVLAALWLVCCSTPARADEALPQWLLRTINEHIRGTLAVGTVDFRFPNGVTLGNARLTDEHGTVLARARRIDATVDIGALTAGNISLPRVTIRDAVLELAREGDELNVLRALEPRDGKGNAEGRALDLSVSEGLMEDLEVHYADRGIDVRVKGVRAAGTVVLYGKTVLAEGEGSARNAVIRAGELVVEGQALRVEKARLAGRALTLEGAHFAVGNAPASTLSGRILIVGEENLFLRGQVNLPEDYWPVGLGELPARHAPVAAAVNLMGTFAKPRWDATGTCARLQKDRWVAVQTRFNVEGTLTGLEVRSASMDVLGGSANLTGHLEFQPTRVDLVAHLHGTRLASVLDDSAWRGALEGRATVVGPLGKDFQIDSHINGTLEGLECGRAVKAPVPMDVDAHVVLTGARLEVKDAALSAPGMEAGANGALTFRNNGLDFRVAMKAAQLERWVPLAGQGTLLRDASLRAVVKGSTPRPRVDGVLRVGEGRYQGVPFAKLVTPWTAKRDRLELLDVRAELAGGTARGALMLPTSETGKLAGYALFQGAQLSRLAVSGVPLAGTAAGRATLTGSRKEPVADFEFRAVGGRVDDQPVEDARARGQLRKGRVTVPLLRVRTAGGALEGSGSYLLDSAEWTAELRADHLRLARVVRLSPQQLSGTVDGTATLGGRSQLESAVVDLGVTDLAHAGAPLGSGTLQVQGAQGEWNGLLELPLAHIRGAGHYQKQSDALALSVDVMGGSLGLVAALVPRLPPMDGTIDAHVNAVGTRLDPVVDARMDLWDARVMMPGEPPVPLGKAHVALQHSAQHVTGLADLFGLADVDVVGSTAEGGTVRVNGKVHVEDAGGVVVSLRSRGLGLALTGGVEAEVDVRAPERTTGTITLSNARLWTLENDQTRLRNQGELVFTYADQRLQVVSASLTGSSTQMRVEGWVSAEEARLTASGDVELAVLSVFTSEVARAEGTLALDAEVTRVRETGWDVRGTLIPRPGAVMLVRALRQQVAFTRGRVVASLSSVRAEGLAAETEDGGLLELEGELQLRDGQPHAVAAEARASAVTVPTSRGEVEGGVDLRLEGAFPRPMLTGQVTLSDGDLRETYALQNFIVTRPSAAPGAPLWQRVPQLEGMRMDVRVSGESVRTRADLGPYRAEATVRGEFHVQGSLRAPAVSGVVESSDGSVRLGVSTFALESGTLEFPLRRDGRVEPVVHLTATTALPPDRSPTRTEFPVTLTLDGPLDRMALDLKAQDDQVRLSRAELLSLVVTGRPARELLGTGGGAASGDAALRLASSQALDFVERRIEDQARRVVNMPVELQLEAGATSGRATARWEANQRIQLETSTDLDFGTSRTTDSSGTRGGPGLRGAARARFLLVDHTPLPGLQTVAFEGALTDVGITRLDAQAVDMKLRARFFEF